MDTNQLQQLALNAELNHWPPHMGVRTDAEKIEYLAQRLREAAGYETKADELSVKVEVLEDENSMLQSEINDLKSKLSEIRELTL